MYVIIVYDVGVERLDGVRHILKQYLNWVQNSAFEGEVSEGVLEEIRLKLIEMIDESSDSILVYKTSNPRWLSKLVWGRERGEASTIVG